MKKRTSGREYAFQFLFKYFLPEVAAFDQSKTAKRIEEFEEFWTSPDEENNNIELGPEVRNFGGKIIYGILNNFQELEDLLEKNFDNPKNRKLELIDKTILYMGVYELQFEKKIPQNVVINEAINLCKKYGTEKSPPLINSILDKVAKSRD